MSAKLIVDRLFSKSPEHTVVSFSGGRTSAYMCSLIKKKYPEAVFIFMDTGEHPATYDFIRECNTYFGLNLVCLRIDVNPLLGEGNSYKQVPIEEIGYDLSMFASLIQKYSTPYNPSGGFCTSMMKNEIFYKYCDTMFGKRNYETWLGYQGR